MNKQKGIGVVEIIVVVGLIGTLVLGLIQFTVLSTQPTGKTVRETQATALAEEGLEALKALRNESWASQIDILTNNTTYYPTVVSSNWTMSTTDPGLVDNTFSRTVVLEAVYRDANDDIAQSGTVDTGTRKATVTVSWNERGTTESVVLETYIANFLVN